MRRMIAYVAMCATMLIGVGVAASPTLLSMDSDLAYAEGKTLYFKASNYNPDSLLGNYDSFLTEEDKDGKTYIVEKIADTMAERLQNWGISDYQISTQGYDTVAVSLRASKNKTLEYSRLESYLSFSGQHYELDASNTSAEASTDSNGETHAGYVGNDKWKTMLDGKTAFVQILDLDNYNVPVVLVPIASEDKSAFLELINYCKEHTVAEEKDEEGNVTTPGESCNVVLWANRIEGVDKYEDKNNPNVADHILFEHSAADDQAVYYAPADTDKENPFFQLIPSSKATESGTYNPEFAQEATDAANYLAAKFNASSFTYDSDAGKASEYRVSFVYSTDVAPTVDPLIELGDWSSSPAMGRTMISVVVGMVLATVILSLFHRLLAAQQIAVAAVTGFGALAIFVAFGAQFNIAALIGLAATVLVSLFQSMFYATRLKNEIYKGRTLKKAHQEAAKASTWVSVDAGVIALIIGIFLYVLGGNVLHAGGVMLTVGGFLSIFTSLILVRFTGWVLCNDSTMQKKFPALLGVNANKLPNLLKEERQTYFGTFQDKKFTTKKAKIYTGAVTAAFILAGIGTMIGFGVNRGDIYNDAAYKAPSTVLRLSVKSEEQDNITVNHFGTTSEIYDAKSNDKADILHMYTIDGLPLADYVSSFDAVSTPKTVYESPDAGEEGTYYYFFYYEAKLNRVFSEEEEYEIAEWNGTAYAPMSEKHISELAAVIAEIGGADKDDVPNVAVSFDYVAPSDLTPSTGNVCLGLGIGLAVTLVYMVLRYRPSRGVATTVAVTAGTYMALSFFVFTRISVAPVVATGMPLVAVFGLLAALFILCREKEIRKEDHVDNRNSFAKRSEHLELATSYEAGNVFAFAILSSVLFISALAIGPTAYFAPYLLGVIGVVINVALILVLNTPCSILIAKGLSHIHFSAPKRKKKEMPGQITKRKKSGEPEEAIFIGIND